MIHTFVIESEKAGSSTSVSNVLATTRDRIRKKSCWGSEVFCGVSSQSELRQAVHEFSAWQSHRDVRDAVVLWMSVHGATPTGSAAWDKVGTSVVDANGNEMEFVDLYIPLWNVNCHPGLIVLHDVCWGASPTAPARLTSRQFVRPRALLGPTSKATRSELDNAETLVFDLLASSAQPAIDDIHKLVDQINQQSWANPARETKLYRAWSWTDAGELVSHPTSTRHNVKPLR